MNFNKTKYLINYVPNNFKPTKLSLIVLVLLCFASNAFANAGTPLMWMGFFRLVFFNILIAIGEALIISFLFKAYYPTVIRGTFKMIGIMLLANYCSWLAGEVGILPMIAKIKDYILADNPLKNAPEFILLMGIIAFVLTVILEWPFCFWALHRKQKRILKSVTACLLVNVCSYAFLVYIYCSFSVYTIYTELSVQPDVSFSQNDNAWVYFVSAKDGNVHRIRLNGTSDEKVYELNAGLKSSSDFFARPQLFVWPSDDEIGWDLWGSDLYDNGENSLLLKNFATKAAKPKYQNGNSYDVNDPRKVNNLGFLVSTDLRQKNKSDWVIYTDFWPAEGLVVEKNNQKETLYYGLETPFLKWFSENATILDGDQVIYQLGNQIILLDLNKRLIGLVALGYGPVVVLE